MAKINIVLEGICKGQKIRYNYGGDCLTLGPDNLDKKHIASYEVIDQFDSDKHSFWRGVAGIVGMAGNKKEYLIAIDWVYPKNLENNRSLIYIDEEFYKKFRRSMF